MIVDLSVERRTQLRGKHGIHVPNHGVVRHGILDWVVENGLEASLNDVEDLVYTNDVVVMEVYGEAFINQASEVATAPLQEVYAYAYADNCLPDSASRTIGECVFRMLVKREHDQTNMQTVGWLRTILRRQLEQAQPAPEMAAIA